MEVTTSEGRVRGTVDEFRGFVYYSFRGVPYAKPPLGRNRFRDPEPPEPRSEVWDATRERSACAQTDPIYRKAAFLGDEDCLYLNAHTPDPGASLPVMVWIHGGGFFAGSGSADWYGPERLVREGVVAISLNYRLGALGFLCLDTEEVPGNAGLKDVVAALRWTRRNAASFGGDPERVTVFGESAGGAAVQFLMISDAARGLFRGAVSQSGSCLCPWASRAEGGERPPAAAAALASSLLGREVREPAEVLRVLRAADARELVEGAARLRTSGERLRDAPFPFAPVVELSFPGAEAFLRTSPSEAVRSGAVARVPHLTGYNSREGLAFLSDAGRPLDLLDGNFEVFVPPDLGLPPGSPGSVRVAAAARDAYFGGGRLDAGSLDGYVDLMTDVAFAKDAVRFARAGAGATYLYRFSYDGGLNACKKREGIAAAGACHEDELGYLFENKVRPLGCEPGSADDATRRRMVAMWTNFAKCGDPVPETSRLLPVKWPPVRSDELKYLEIDAELAVETNPDAARMAFWEEIYAREGLSSSDSVLEK